MPIPKPSKGEKKNDFISRCLDDKVMLSEYTNKEQRIAICETTWTRRNMKKHNCTFGIAKVRSPGLPDKLDNSFTLLAREVSLVGSPANQRKFLLFKSADKVNIPDDKNPGGKDPMPKYEALIKSVEGTTFTQDETAWLKKVGVKDDLHEDMALALRILVKHQSVLPADMVKNAMSVMTDGMPKPTVVEKVVEKLVEKKADDGPFDHDAFLSELEKANMSEPIKIGLRQMAKASKANTVKLTETETELSKEKAARARAEALGQISKNFPNVTVDQDDLADLLIFVKKHDDDKTTYGKIFDKVLERHEKIAADLFKELGSSAGYHESDAYKRLEQIAKEIQEKEHLSQVDAMKAAMKRNPAIYKEYEAQTSPRQ